jgi:hypothetical protein
LTHEVALYNGGEKEVNIVVKNWFDYPTTTIDCLLPRLQGRIFLLFSAMFLVINVVILVGMIILLINRPVESVKTWKRLLIFAFSFYGTNACFAIFFQPVELMSMTSAIILYPAFILLLLSLFTAPESFENIAPNSINPFI